MQLRELTKGITTSNPLFVIVLGVCPSLATSGELKTAFAMGLAATFVCVGSNVIISLLRNVIPSQVRIPCYIVVIATFVTIVDLFLKAYFPAISKSIGVFIPLIVVNCIILGPGRGRLPGRLRRHRLHRRHPPHVRNPRADPAPRPPQAAPRHAHRLRVHGPHGPRLPRLCRNGVT